MLLYVLTLAKIHEQKLTLEQITSKEIIQILELRILLDKELYNLYFYTNITNNLDSYLLFSVFTRKALEELKYPCKN